MAVHSFVSGRKRPLPDKETVFSNRVNGKVSALVKFTMDFGNYQFDCVLLYTSPYVNADRFAYY